MPPAPPLDTQITFNSLVLLTNLLDIQNFINLNNSSGSVLRGTTKNEFCKSI